MTTDTLAYKRAFEAYLRRGTPIEWSIKQASRERPTTHYVWRTQHLTDMATAMSATAMRPMKDGCSPGTPRRRPGIRARNMGAGVRRSRTIRHLQNR